MTRKSAIYIGKECYNIAEKLEQSTRWLTRKIQRKIKTKSEIKIYDSYYDITGLYLVFKETTLDNVAQTMELVNEAAMVNTNSLKIIMNCKWKNTDCFMIYIPFRAYSVYGRCCISDYINKDFSILEIGE